MRTDGPIYASGTVRHGRLRIAQSNVLAAQLSELRDGVVEIEVRRKRATRSQQANSYYWGVVLRLLSETTGYHPDELHEHFKREFLPKAVALCDGDGVILSEGTIGQTTTKLSVSEFYAYVERIRQVAAEMGCVTPDPQ